MSAIRLSVSSDLAKLERSFDKIGARVQAEIARGLNEGGDKVRTQVRRAMKEQTGLLKLSSITKRQRTMRAYQGSLNYSIVFAGKPSTKPDEFRARVTLGHGGGVTVWMWNVAHKFKRSFKQKLRRGLRMRVEASRLPIRGFDGPNLAKEAVKGDVATTFLERVAAFVHPAIEKRLSRL